MGRTPKRPAKRVKPKDEVHGFKENQYMGLVNEHYTFKIKMLEKLILTMDDKYMAFLVSVINDVNLAEDLRQRLRIK